MKGFSETNLKYIKRFYLFYAKNIENSMKTLIGQQLVDQLENVETSKNLILQQPVAELEFPQILGQIPWGHHILIFSNCDSVPKALFYINKTIENSWSRAVLMNFLDTDLYERQGKAVNNFARFLPKPQSDLARDIIKDPYNFDFLTLRDKYDEKELEENLVEHMSRFLLELGSGFSFVGSQYKLSAGNEDFYVDLLFYHTRLHCYVAVELKTVEFKPEFSGKLGFYTSVIDGKLKTKADNPTIGILICKSKNKTVVEYALNAVKNPIGVSDYKIMRSLPKNFKSSLPSIEEIEKELNKREKRNDK